MVPWSDNEIVNEAFSVIMSSDGEDYFPHFLRNKDELNPLKTLEKWVNENNVKKIRFHLSSPEIDEYCFGDDFGEIWVEDAKEFTDSEIILHKRRIKDFCKDENIIFSEEYCYDKDTEEVVCYNEKWFLNGSDKLMYTLIEKID